jgi:predicted O-linked N-acetylglucosamine transferase (SPINDLY family)
MPALSIEQVFALAFQYHQAGRWAEAEQLYRQILSARPDHAEAWRLLGLLAHQGGRQQLAVECLGRAIALGPQNAVSYSDLGNVLRSMGRLPEALRGYRESLRLKPDRAEVWNALGVTLACGNGRDEAAGAFRQAIGLDRNYAEAHNNLGIVLMQEGKIEEAVASYQEAIRCKEDYAQASNNLGVAFARWGRLEDAMAALRRAVEIDGRYAEAHNNLGNVFKNNGLLKEAMASYRRALEAQPNYALAQYNLGNILSLLGRGDEAAGAFRRAIELEPKYGHAYVGLGRVLMDQGDVADCIDVVRRGVSLLPDDPALHSNLILLLELSPGIDRKVIAEEKRRWSDKFEREFRMQNAGRRVAGPDSAERRLRIGYVIPGLENHVVGLNIRPLLEEHDRSQFEIVGYATGGEPRLAAEDSRAIVDLWRSTAGLDDAGLAELIRRDQVDVLVDLGQHTSGNRLPVFARRPAPVQVSFAGYPESTGLEAIPYRISDRWLESEIGDGGSEIGWKRETQLRTPIFKLRSVEQIYFLDSFWCYDPRGMDVPVNELPAAVAGRITFGSLNHFSKINEATLSLWARVLRELVGSHLMLLTGWGSHRQRALDFLFRHGVEADRVEFVDRCPREKYLALYHRLDLALDPFPYGGHTTSLDALWMGVPVISIAGRRPVSRAGWSILNNVGLPELVTFSEDDFVDAVCRLARDFPRLQELRRTLRARMEKSVLMDVPRFARQIEAAYRSMWREWCTKPK